MRIFFLTCCVLTMSVVSFAADAVVFVSAFAPGVDGAIHAYRFDAATGQLKLLHRTTDIDSFFQYGVATGTLTPQQTISTLPADFTGSSHTADIKITPNGKFLYGTNRGHDSIAIFRIANDGHLELVRIEPSLGKGPQNLLITPDGRWLICANMPGNNVVVFAIDAETGGLTAKGDAVSIPMPSCIRWWQ